MKAPVRALLVEVYQALLQAGASTEEAVAWGEWALERGVYRAVAEAAPGVQAFRLAGEGYLVQGPLRAVRAGNIVGVLAAAAQVAGGEYASTARAFLEAALAREAALREALRQARDALGEVVYAAQKALRSSS